MKVINCFESSIIALVFITNFFFFTFYFRYTFIIHSSFSFSPLLYLSIIIIFYLVNDFKCCCFVSIRVLKTSFNGCFYYTFFSLSSSSTDDITWWYITTLEHTENQCCSFEITHLEWIDINYHLSINSMELCYAVCMLRRNGWFLFIDMAMVKPLINAICRWDYGILLLDDKEEQHLYKVKVSMVFNVSWLRLTFFLYSLVKSYCRQAVSYRNRF